MQKERANLKKSGWMKIYGVIVEDVRNQGYMKVDDQGG